MTRRRSMTKARRDRIALRQFERADLRMPCALCGQDIEPGHIWIAEHMVPFALGGADDDGEDNVRPAHAECAARKTGGTAGTGHRGDIANIARAVRLSAGGKKPRGPKIKSQGFDTRLKRKLNGKTEERA